VNKIILKALTTFLHYKRTDILTYYRRSATKCRDNALSFPSVTWSFHFRHTHTVDWC